MVKRAFAAVAIACICSTITEARVTRIEILKVERVDPPSGAPGALPPYERVSGKFYGELDPADPKNALIRLKGQSCGLSGGFIPFARTKVERVAKGDPRPSLEERYRSHDEYVQIVRAAAAKLVQERYLLQQDADAMIIQAEASDVLR